MVGVASESVAVTTMSERGVKKDSADIWPGPDEAEGYDWQ